MIKKLSAIFIALSLTSCACYGDLFKKSSPTAPVLVEAPEVIKKYQPNISEVKKTVFFETNSIAISSDAQKVLNEGVLPAIKDKKIIVEGNSDERGSADYNKILGKKRAEAVKNYLVKNGAISSQIITVSHGESNPLDLNHDEKAWEANRRAVTIWTEQ
jgi:peptidoglycan-associated lipoprotein